MRRLIVSGVLLVILLGVIAAQAVVAAGGPAAVTPSPAVRQASPPAPLPPAPEAAWTVLVYMDGDNNLEKWVSHDIDKELAAVGSSADVQVVVLADRGPGHSASDGDWKGTLAFHVTKGMKATPENAVADWGEQDMGSPQTLADSVTWAHESYPARHTALFLWDHGWGWWPDYTLWDATSNDSMDMDEIRRGMEAAGGVDNLGMDTCLGQMIEVEATFRGFATRSLPARTARLHGRGLRAGAPKAQAIRAWAPPRWPGSNRVATAAVTTAGRWRVRQSPSTGGGTGSPPR